MKQILFLLFVGVGVVAYAQSAPSGPGVPSAIAARYISVGTTEDEHAVKTTAGVLYSVTVTNTNADERYLKCYNATAANTTPGTTTPWLSLAVPGNAAGNGFTTTFPLGAAFSTALTCALVTGAADSDVTEVAADELLVFYTFK